MAWTWTRPRARLRGRSPPGRVHRAATRRPRPGAGVQPPARRRRSRTASTSPTPSPRSTPTRCGTCGWTRATARSPPSSPGPRRCSTPPRGWPARPGPASGCSREPQRGPPERRDARRRRRWSGGWSGSPNRGDRLLAELRTADAARHDGLVGGPEDLFRPTAADHRRRHPVAALRPLGRRPGRGVGRAGSTRRPWSAPQPVSDTDGPSFNQEVVALPDGSLHVCWQGRSGDRFGVFARRWDAGAWEETGRVSDAASRQRLGPHASPSIPDGDGLRLGRVRGRQLRRGAAPCRACGAAGPSAGSPAAPTTPCTRAWPRPPTAGCGARST